MNIIFDLLIYICIYKFPFMKLYISKNVQLWALSINITSPGTLLENEDVNGTFGNVTILQRGRLQLKTDTFLKIWSIHYGYLQF